MLRYILLVQFNCSICIRIPLNPFACVMELKSNRTKDKVLLSSRKLYHYVTTGRAVFPVPVEATI